MQKYGPMLDPAPERWEALDDDERISVVMEYHQEVGKILAAWNPLGDVEAAAIGLSDYEAEAIDILFVMDLYGYSAKKAVSEILQEAFLIDLEKTELDHYGSKIEAVLAEK